jgi:hypothetical protein
MNNLAELLKKMILFGYPLHALRLGFKNQSVLFGISPIRIFPFIEKIPTAEWQIHFRSSLLQLRQHEVPAREQ